MRGVEQLEARLLWEQEVAGSSPVTPTRIFDFYIHITKTGGIMEIIRKNPDNLPTPLAAYSQVVRAGNIITTAGFIATNQSGDLVGEGDIGKQTRQSIENMIKALESVDSSLENVIKVTVYLSDMTFYKQMNIVYNEYFENIKPARATVEGKLVLPSLLFEIDAIAVC